MIDFLFLLKNKMTDCTESKKKIRLWEIVNKILKDTGSVDIEIITAELTDLKNQMDALIKILNKGYETLSINSK
jgi:uncharacterized protein YutE (UPF0331/DUF86 family)